MFIYLLYFEAAALNYAPFCPSRKERKTCLLSGCQRLSRHNNARCFISLNGKVLANGATLGRGEGALRKRSTNAVDSGHTPNSGSPFSSQRRKGKSVEKKKTKTRVVAPNWQCRQNWSAVNDETFVVNTVIEVPNTQRTQFT